MLNAQVDNHAQGRVDAWEATSGFMQTYPRMTHRYIIACAEQAQGVESHKALNHLEQHYFNEIITDGSLGNRKRFWKFVMLNSRGIVPRDLRKNRRVKFDLNDPYGNVLALKGELVSDTQVEAWKIEFGFDEDFA